MGFLRVGDVCLSLFCLNLAYFPIICCDIQPLHECLCLDLFLCVKLCLVIISGWPFLLRMEKERQII